MSGRMRYTLGYKTLGRIACAPMIFDAQEKRVARFE